MSGDQVREGRRGVFYMHDDVYDLWAKELGVYGVAVYGLLCRRAGNDATCYPSLNGTAKLLGISKSKLVTTLDMLEAKKFISRTARRNKKGGHTSTLYTVHEPPYLVRTEDKPLVRDENTPSTQQGQPLTAGRTGRNTQGRTQKNKVLSESKKKNYMEGHEHLLVSKKRRREQ